MIADLIVGVPALAGAVLVLLAGIGVLRFRDLYARMHAAAKASTIGFLLVCIAGATGISGGAARVVLAAGAIFVTAPSAAHFIGRAAYRAEGIEMRLEGGDELAELIDEGDA